MDKFESLSHTAWDCKYHVIFIPKCRRRTLYTQLRQHLGEVFRKLASQKESRVEEGHPGIRGLHRLKEGVARQQDRMQIASAVGCASVGRLLGEGGVQQGILCMKASSTPAMHVA